MPSSLATVTGMATAAGKNPALSGRWWRYVRQLQPRI